MDRDRPDLRRAKWIGCALLVALALQSWSALSVLGVDSPPAGSERRAAWTSSRITGSPEPPFPFTTERAFPSLQFNQCLDLAAAPGSDRLWVVEQSGKIYSFRNQPDVNQADLAIDLAKQVPGAKQAYAIAFHPDFQRNRLCFVCYIRDPDLPDGTHIARFRVTDADPPTIDPASETTIITWLSGGHNGCCLKFGPDGCLYISTGDGTGPNPPDILRAGQDLSNLLSAILRIDVDRTEPERNYRIPSDNPFIDLPNARPEIWAYGLRNPWRMSFDRKTGELWAGDVGWEMWEMLYRIERGGNYGWAVKEGRQSINPEWPRGPTPILPPTIDHSHTESSSITDGLTYYGSRLPQLQGMHIYSDYDTGKFWGFRYEEGRVKDHRELADTTHRVVGFGEDNSGEFYILDHTAGTLHRMIANPRSDNSAAFPVKLSETGLFSTTMLKQPSPGVIPYSIVAEPWSDFAIADRWVAVPGQQSITVEPSGWKYPVDSVLVKTLAVEMTQGDASSRRTIETQILHFDGLDWQPYSYRWDEDESDAVLVSAAGSERILEVRDTHAPGGTRRQTWRFAGRAECQRCHNKWSGPVLGFNSPQLQRPAQGSTNHDTHLQRFAQVQLLDKPVPEATGTQLVDPRDASAEINSRARSYLHVNCAHCHRLHAGGAVLSHMPFDVPLDKSNMVGVRPTQGTFGIHSAEVLAPGEPFRSVLLYRMSKLGGGRMPHIGSAEIDRAGVELIHDWIQRLAPAGNPTSGDLSVASRLVGEQVENMARLRSARSDTDQLAMADRLLATTSGAMMLAHHIARQEVPDSIASLAINRGTQHADSAVRDLFERYLPPEKRVKRLGSTIDPQQISALNGSGDKGRRVFFETAGVACKNCHRIGQEGKEVGPDLSTIGKKLDRAQLLESVLDPSKRIDPKYVTYLAETVDGRLISGLLLQRTEAEVVLKDAMDQVHQIPADKIVQLVPQQQSLMPDLLLRDMTAQQVADLLAFLESLK